MPVTITGTQAASSGHIMPDCPQKADASDRPKHDVNTPRGDRHIGDQAAALFPQNQRDRNEHREQIGKRPHEPGVQMSGPGATVACPNAGLRSR